jgi:DNA processing protein
MKIQKLSEQERLDWLRLIRSEQVGHHTFFRLLSLYGTAEKALQEIPYLIKNNKTNRKIKLCSEKNAIDEIEKCKKIGAKLIASYEPNYPSLLRQTKGHPPIITVLGNDEVLNNRMVAIVGARNASANGCELAKHFAQELSNKDIQIISGLARGIDTYAHKGSINHNPVAIIAGGIDHIYPKENKDLFNKIVENGAVIAELPIGSVPQARHFPQRNRIISGMALGTVVVEATKGSGSLITANIANDQGREVMAVPGSPLDPRCAGTNELIKNGAMIITCVDDIIDTIGGISSSLFDSEVAINMEHNSHQPTENEIEAARPVITEKLGTSPVAIDTLIAQTGFHPNIILTVILELELSGRLDNLSGNRVVLKINQNDLFSVA